MVVVVDDDVVVDGERGGAFCAEERKRKLLCLPSLSLSCFLECFNRFTFPLTDQQLPQRQIKTNTHHKIHGQKKGSDKELFQRGIFARSTV